MKWVWIAIGAIVAIIGIVAGVGALLPENHTVTLSSRFEQRPLVLWNAIAGPPTWRPDVKSFEVLPARGGHRAWREIDAHGNSVTYEALEEIPPVRMITRIADPGLPYGGIWVHEITIEPNGCVLQITENGRVYNPIFRFVSRFVIGYTATIDRYFKALHAKFGEKS